MIIIQVSECSSQLVPTFPSLTKAPSYTTSYSYLYKLSLILPIHH